MSTDSPTWLSIVREKVESLRYGVVQIVVHNSRVTQIERAEKIRLDQRDEGHFSNRPDELEALPFSGTMHRTTGNRS